MHVGLQKKELLESVEVNEMVGVRDLPGAENGSIVSA
jgi:hypothetical protein